MRKLAHFLWKIDRFNAYWSEGQSVFSRVRYCLHEFLWETKQYGISFYSAKKWLIAANQ